MFKFGNILNLQAFSRRFIFIGIISLFLVTGCLLEEEDPGLGNGPDNSNLSISNIDPAPNAIGVPLNKNIVVALNIDLQSATVDGTTVFITDPDDQRLSANVVYNTGSKSITIDPDLTLDAIKNYTVTVTPGVKATNNSSLASNYNTTFTTAAGDLPPEFTLWETNMIANGNTWGAYQNPGVNGFSARFNNAYYDILWNMYQIKEYTGQDEPWNTYIAYARSAYRDQYYRPATYNIGEGYQRFSHGLLVDFLATRGAGGGTTLLDVQRIRDNPAFSDLGEFSGGYDGPCQNITREMSYALQSHINAEKAGEDRDVEKVSQFVAWLENHLWEWYSDTFRCEAFFQPFMFALNAHALIEFYEWEVQSGRNPNAYWPTTHWATIPDALAEFSSWMYNDALVRYGSYTGERMWVADFEAPGYGGFRYADRQYEEGAGAIYPGLNLLTAPVYIWVYKITGDADFRNMGDVIFKGGVPYGNSGASGKEFDQNYRWSFKYIQWRSEADQLWQ